MNSPIISWRENKKNYQFLGKTGKVSSFTQILNPPEGFGKLPYWVAIVQLNHGKKLVAQLVLDGKKPKIGVRVKAVLRIIGQPEKEEIINYGVKFKLI